MPIKPSSARPRVTALLASLALLSLLLAAGCDVGGVPGAATPTSPTSHGGTVRDHGTLLDALRKSGLTVNPTGRISQPFLSVEGESVDVNGQAIQSYEYPDEQAAQSDASKIQPNGTIPGTQITWVAQPHFYRTGKLIVIYPGNDQTVLDALEATMGKPFATGASTTSP